MLLLTSLRSVRERRLVRWDMRAREGAVQDSPVLTYQEGKDYASKPNFNCMATSGGASSPCTCAIQDLITASSSVPASSPSLRTSTVLSSSFPTHDGIHVLDP